MNDWIEGAAILLSVLSLLGTVINIWLKLEIKTELADAEKRIIAQVAEHYPARELVDVKLDGLDRRIGVLERRAAP